MQKLTLSILFRPIIVLLLAAFAGCVTSKIEYVESDKLPKRKVYHITEVFMKNGTSRNLRNKDPEFKIKYKGIENVIIYDDNGKETLISLKDIDKIEIEVMESNVVLSIFIIIGSIVLFCLILYWLFGGLAGFKN